MIIRLYPFRWYRSSIPVCTRLMAVFIAQLRQKGKLPNWRVVLLNRFNLCLAGPPTCRRLGPMLATFVSIWPNTRRSDTLRSKK